MPFSYITLSRSSLVLWYSVIKFAMKCNVMRLLWSIKSGNDDCFFSSSSSFWHLNLIHFKRGDYCCPTFLLPFVFAVTSLHMSVGGFPPIQYDDGDSRNVQTYYHLQTCFSLWWGNVEREREGRSSRKAVQSFEAFCGCGHLFSTITKEEMMSFCMRDRDPTTPGGIRACRDELYNLRG